MAGAAGLAAIQSLEFHRHILERMAQRGVAASEVEIVLADGWAATDVRPGTQGRLFVFKFDREWEGRFYEEKEVAIYFKDVNGVRVLLTVKARYGSGFPRGSIK